MYNLNGRVALVTGAAGRNGIGRAIALRLAGEGADIALNDLSDTARTESAWTGLSAVKREVEELGRKAEIVTADVTDAVAVNAMVATVTEKLGRIDILVNNAAALAGDDRVPVVDLEEKDWDRVMTVNVKGTYLCSKAVVKRMIEQGAGGKIINLSSVSGLKGSARFAAYCSSKFAIIGFTQSLAKEVGQYRINVNAICPDRIDNERTREIAAMVKPEEITTEEHLASMYEQTIRMTPLGRVGTPEDVAKAAAFLASAESDFLTGIHVIVAGGQVT